MLGRRRWAIAAAAGLGAITLVTLAVVSSRDHGSSPPGDSAPVISTSPSTTAVPITSGAAAVPEVTTTSVGTDSTTPDSAAAMGLVPACIEREPAPGAPTSWPPWPAASTLSPLGAAPSLVIDLPEQRTPNRAELEPVSSAVTLVPGGFLVHVRADVGGSMLTLVDIDGTVRWQRCLATTPLVTASPAGRHAVLLLPEYDPAGGETWAISTVSLVDGGTGPSLEGVIGERTRFAASTDDGPVFVHAGPHTVDETNDRMASIDLVSLEVVDLPYPPGSNGTDPSALMLERNWWTGQLVWRTSVDNRMVATAVLVDGAWSTDAAVLAAQPTGHYFTGDDGAAGGNGWFLEFRDGRGTLRWERRDILNPGGEGFTSGVAGDIVIVRGCAAASQGTCFEAGAEWSLYGLDAATGATRWERSGAWDVSVIADGKALVQDVGGDPTEWSMIDIVTGELAAADQMWADPAAFDYECCGGGDYVHVGVAGDVVIASNYGRVALWFPKDRSAPTRQITLP